MSNKGPERLKRGVWTDDEDDLLRTLISERGVLSGCDSLLASNETLSDNDAIIKHLLTSCFISFNFSGSRGAACAITL
jgi:hypothetical protein